MRDTYGKSREWQRRWKRGIERAFAPEMKEFRFEVSEFELMMDLDRGYARSAVTRAPRPTA